jgi:hypothetical protein
LRQSKVRSKVHPDFARDWAVLPKRWQDCTSHSTSTI